jgi:hypothetical protein
VVIEQDRVRITNPIKEYVVPIDMLDEAVMDHRGLKIKVSGHRDIRPSVSNTSIVRELTALLEHPRGGVPAPARPDDDPSVPPGFSVKRRLHLWPLAAAVCGVVLVRIARERPLIS